MMVRAEAERIREIGWQHGKKSSQTVFTVFFVFPEVKNENFTDPVRFPMAAEREETGLNRFPFGVAEREEVGLNRFPFGARSAKGRVPAERNKKNKNRKRKEKKIC